MLCGPLGLFVLWDGVRTLYRVIRTRMWPVTDVYIMYAGAEEIETAGITRSEGTYLGTGHLPLVVYEYAVGEKIYRGAEIRARPERVRNRAWALRKARLYRTCTSVRYNPDNPSQSVLDTRIELRDFFPILLGIGIIALGLWPLL
jgi:hypothetical protein